MRGGVGVVQVLVAVEVLPSQCLGAGLKVLVVPHQGLGAGYEAVHNALGQGDVILLLAAVPSQGLARVQGFGTGPEVLGGCHLSDASVAIS